MDMGMNDSQNLDLYIVYVTMLMLNLLALFDIMARPTCPKSSGVR